MREQRCMCKELTCCYCRGMSQMLSKSIDLGSLSQDQENKLDQLLIKLMAKLWEWTGLKLMISKKTK